MFLEASWSAETEEPLIFTSSSSAVVPMGKMGVPEINSTSERETSPAKVRVTLVEELMPPRL